MGTFRTLPAPQLQGLSLSTGITWSGSGGYFEIAQSSPECSILGIQYQLQAVPTADTTEEYLIEIATGAAGAETNVLEIPTVLRSDTAVGYYNRAQPLFLPEPFSVSAGTRLSARARTGSGNSRTVGAFRLLIDQLAEDAPRTYGIGVNQSVQRSAVI